MVFYDLKYHTDSICMAPDTLETIQSWCMMQYESDAYYIQDVGAFLDWPVICIHFMNESDHQAFCLTWI